MRKTVLIGISSSILFITIFLNQLILNMDKPLSDPDNMYQYFLIENNLKKFSKLDFNNPYDTRMFYPLKNTLALGNSQFIQSLISLPAYLLTKNVIISTHTMVLANFFLAFLIMYFLVFHFTKSVEASILGGLIFTYNPYVMAQFYFELLTLFWIPLIFLVTEKMLKGGRKWVIILPLVFLGQLISSFYYCVFLLITWPIYLMIRGSGVIRKIRGIWGWMLLSTAICMIIGALYLQPYLEIKSSFGMTRRFDNVIYHSAAFEDFISTTKDNKFYGHLLGTKFTDYTEHSLFAGFVVYILVLISLWLFLNKKIEPHLRNIFIPVVVIWAIAFIFSFGPYFIVGETLIPNVYLLFYKFLPFFDSLRAPSRFFVMGFFSMSILASFAANYLMGRLRKSRGLGKLGVILGLVFLISLEYQHNLAPPFEIKPEVKTFYQWLDKQPQIKVIVELPIANELVNNPTVYRSYFDDSKYLLYALDHEKKLINGNAAYNPPQRTALGKQLTINFPTQEKINQLKNMEVHAIIVHREEYHDPILGQEVTKKLQQFDLKEIYKSEKISAFLLVK